MTAALFVLGLAALVVGARMLVSGASRLASAFGVSSYVVGLTVVAFGTSAPELATAVQAAWSAQPGIAVGNVVGSNIFNVLFVLGIAAAVAPIVVKSRTVRIDVPVMIGSSVALYLFAADGSISRLDGVAFIAALAVYLATTFRRNSGRDEILPEAESAVGARHTVSNGGVRIALDAGGVIAGLALLTFGSDWLVSSSISIARAAGVSELVIGLTIVSVGTSLPEVATAVLAVRHGKGDIAVGSVVGSNIFNMLSVLGAAAVVAPDGIAVAPDALDFDIPVMIGVVVMALPVFYTGMRVTRGEGVLFLSYYAAYGLALFLIARRMDALAVFSRAMVWAVIPVTALTLALLATHAYRQKRRRSRGVG